MLRKLLVPVSPSPPRSPRPPPPTPATARARRPAGRHHRVRPAPSAPQAGDTYFAATLLGRNEVAGAGRQGRRQERHRGRGVPASTATRWSTPSAGRAPPPPAPSTSTRASRRKNGDVKIPFFGAALPVHPQRRQGRRDDRSDSALLNRIKRNPAGWYANLHTGEFPGGAVRAQLTASGRSTSTRSWPAGSRSTLTAIADGRAGGPGPRHEGRRQERQGRLAGLGEGHQGPLRDRVEEHRPADPRPHPQGPQGQERPGRRRLPGAPSGLPAGINGIAGTGTASSSVAKGIKNNPKNWYTNLHTPVSSPAARCAASCTAAAGKP